MKNRHRTGSICSGTDGSAPRARSRNAYRCVEGMDSTVYWVYMRPSLFPRLRVPLLHLAIFLFPAVTSPPVRGPPIAPSTNPGPLRALVRCAPRPPFPFPQLVGAAHSRGSADAPSSPCTVRGVALGEIPG